MKLVNIITEITLKSILLDEIIELGTSGYTVFEVSGSGKRGKREGDFSLSQNIQIEIVCDEETAKKIIDHCKTKYSKNYAMMIFVSDVDVINLEE
ncbi:MAG: transcriptional regulator [Ignavibacteria bacterium]|jgi:nitrogen regulatory protein PII|nr:transcriptional regulator [Ignavibacteria bacterium]MDH7526845.1 P-II family nitrogen regulator [Ignavibacteria bacterium]